MASSPVAPAIGGRRSLAQATLLVVIVVAFGSVVLDGRQLRQASARLAASVDTEVVSVKLPTLSVTDIGAPTMNSSPAPTSTTSIPATSFRVESSSGTVATSGSAVAVESTPQSATVPSSSPFEPSPTVAASIVASASGAEDATSDAMESVAKEVAERKL